MACVRLSTLAHTRASRQVRDPAKHLARLARMAFLAIMISPWSVQSDRSVIPIAVDPAKDETMPYATYYWYDGWFDEYPAHGDETGAIWLTFVETSPQGPSRVVARRVSVNDQHVVQLTEAYAVSDSTAGIIRSDPVIENFMGCAVAVWAEENGPSKGFWYSRFADSAWTSPGLIIEDPSIGSAAVFITDDAEDLESQDSMFNRLFWLSGNSIMSSALDEQLSWADSDTVYTSAYPVGGLMARRDLDNDLWLLFDERDSQDSITVRVIVLDESTGLWSAPMFLIRTAGQESQAGLNLHLWYWEEQEMHLSWADQSVYRDTIIHMSAGMATLQGGWYGPIPGDDLRISSNTLLTSGCIVGPLVHVCYSTKVDSLYRIVWLNDSWWEQGEVLAIRGRPTEHLAMSGLTNCHFLCCWSESDGEQSNIYAVCRFISIGSTDEHPGASPQLELLSCGPNPTADRATIRFRMPRAGRVLVGLYDHGGRIVQEIDAGWQSSDEHAIRIDMNDLADGVYWCRVRSSSASTGHRIVLVR